MYKRRADEPTESGSFGACGKPRILADFAQKYDSIISPETQVGASKLPTKGILERRMVVQSDVLILRRQEWAACVAPHDLPEVLSILYFTPKSP